MGIDYVLLNKLSYKYLNDYHSTKTNINEYTIKNEKLMKLAGRWFEYEFELIEKIIFKNENIYLIAVKSGKKEEKTYFAILNYCNREYLFEYSEKHNIFHFKLKPQTQYSIEKYVYVEDKEKVTVEFKKRKEEINKIENIKKFLSLKLYKDNFIKGDAFLNKDKIQTIIEKIDEKRNFKLKKLLYKKEYDESLKEVNNLIEEGEKWIKIVKEFQIKKN